ncbi:MAG: helix-turn-helix transcriptional regulator [Planctomycetales bacterium]|nr:helix-turn-helix transcriptional regulator [Planctomycetales bacterium]
MAKSPRLRMRELRALFALLNECCELGADPVAWRQHLAKSLPALFASQIAVVAEGLVVARPFEDPLWLQPVCVADHGWSSPEQRQIFAQTVAGSRPEDGPHVTPDLLQRRFKTVQWHQAPRDCKWYEHPFYQECVRHTGVDDGLFAHYLISEGRMLWVFVNRATGERPYDARLTRLMRLLNTELAGLLGKKLARIDGPTVTDLPPRQRSVLICLMEGDTESQCAKRLGISRHTVHDYVKMLYERFGVHSRGELLARCRAFWPALEQWHSADNGSVSRNKN